MSSPAPQPPSAPPAALVSATPISVQPPPPIQPKPPPPQLQPQPHPTGAASAAQPTLTPQQLLNLGPQPPQYRGPICWNSYCKDPDPNSFGRRGWKVRSGPPFSVYADLCGRCYSQFEQGIYCETFHSDEGGWRNCESCGRRVHCGCIVSIHKYQLRDAGGVDCSKCARNTRSALAPPSPVWSSSMHPSQNVADRKDNPVKSWRPPAGQISSQWRQTNLWSLSSIQSDLQQRLAYEFDRPSGSEKLLPGRTFIHAQERKFDDMHDRPTTPAGMNQVMREREANGHSQPTSLDPVYSYTLYHRDGPHPNSLHDPSHHGENDSMSSRRVAIPDASTGVDAGFKLDSHHPSILKDDPPSLSVGLASNFASSNGPKDHIRIAPSQQQSQMASSSLQKQYYSHTVSGYNEFQAQLRNGRPRMDAKARSQLLPRYWPRITDQELQHLSGEYPTSNSVITPLFEKMLSASDAGRIGRLVLPKKCAEAYFPPISQPEGLPLKVQDASGKEWIFQFRFWPNNNSRMYVLEGVTPCIQSMQLQAGDTVTFSRIDPEGKLIMGFRKATNLSSEQEQTTKPANGAPASSEANGQVSAPDLSPNAAVSRQNKVNTESKSPSPVEQAIASKLAQKEGPGTGQSSPGPVKRKATSVGQKIKRLRMDTEESMELKITWEEAQELLRPPPKAPSIVVVDGHEFEEYEEPPILGRKTYFVTDQSGANHQWAQCEDCSKWRKLPVDALLPSKWTCFDNKWDPERSSCEPAQEISMEELAELIPIKPGPGGAKKPKTRIEPDTIDASDGLDTLANLAILGEGEALPSQPTTRHPRHRPGCSCIVCIQPPSGKGPKHKQTCTCNVCMTVRRRFRTLMLRREKRQTKDTDSPRKKEAGQSSEMISQSGSGPLVTTASATSSPQKAEANTDGPEDMAVDHKMTSSPVKNHIDLNIQPEREDEQSPKADAAGAMRLLRDNPT
ncbi:B3 domain-containing protein Os07g0563300-like isoform X1 [Phragmites australis]|uniref:B3 domain-containing protein Os07g0563300-like isoform X1 n=1 Tax=Phragmites australis TaxID=29695 RepID=UPI002D79A26D|nr:B3 domain-containing protein Os07g0563300-like isoform X1 [Phragmites australis]